MTGLRQGLTSKGDTCVAGQTVTVVTGDEAEPKSLTVRRLLSDMKLIRMALASA